MVTTDEEHRGLVVDAWPSRAELASPLDTGMWPGVADPVRLLNEITAWLRHYGNHGTRSTYANGLGLPTGVSELHGWLADTHQDDQVGAARWAQALRTYADAVQLTGRLTSSSAGENTTARTARGRPGRFRDLHWLRWCARHDLDPVGVTTQHVLTWLDDLSTAGAAPSTRERMLATVRALYQHLTTVGLVAANPADVDRRTLNLTHHASTSSTITLTPTQVAVLYDTAGQRRRGASSVDIARAQAVVGLLTLGLRVSEMCDLDRVDLHTTRGHGALRVHGKGGKTRIVYLTDLAATSLDTYLALDISTTISAVPAATVRPFPGAGSPAPATTGAGAASAPLLVGRGGARCTRHGVYQLLRRVAHAAGPALADVASAMHPHALRHFYVTTGVETGAQMADIQADVGHASIDTTQRIYNHAARDPERTAANLVAASITAHTQTFQSQAKDHSPP
jgi:site-specific recombinase XerD